MLLTHFNDDDATEPKTFSLDLAGFGGKDGTEVEFYLLDEAHNATHVGGAVYYGDRFTPVLTLPNYTTYLIKLKKR